MDRSSGIARAVAPRLTRRGFLAGTAGAAGSAGLAVLSAAVVRGTQAGSKVEIGLVGCGGRGGWIARLFQRHGGYQVTAVADYFPQAADACGEALGVGNARRFSGLSGYKRLIDSRVDGVVLQTPPWFFPAHAAAAVEAGCHVYMAKPVAVDVPGCLSIAESARKATAKKRCFLVDFQTRTDPFWQEAVRRCGQGALGKLAMVSSYYTDEGFADPPKTKAIDSRLRSLIWVNDVDLGGGYLVNAGIHAVDAALWLIGSAPKAAVGLSRTGRRDPHGDSDDVFSITYEFGDGLILNHRGEHIGNAYGFTCGLHAYGQGAHMEANYDGQTFIRGGKLAYRGGTVQGLYEAGAVRNIEAFHKCITQGIFDNPTAESGVASTLATILGRDAAKARTTLTWDEMLKAGKRIELDLTGLKE